jgi:hypothetical protein
VQEFQVATNVGAALAGHSSGLMEIDSAVRVANQAWVDAHSLSTPTSPFSYDDPRFPTADRFKISNFVSPVDLPPLSGGEAASLITGFVPVASTVQSVYEIVTGTDAYTGESRSRVWATAGAVLSIVDLKFLVAGKEVATVASAAKTIDTAAVRFTQDSIGATFKNGQSINDVAAALRASGGEKLASQFPAIRLVEHEGQLFTLDNRRLAAFSAAGRQVPFRMATPAEISAEWSSKFTTTAEQGWGKYITVRPPKP